MSVEFVVARRDLPTTRNDIRGKIRAGSLVRADHAAVREAPDEFFTPCRCVFEIEIDEYARDEGRWLRKLTSRTVFEQQPPPGPNAENEWRDYWAGALRERGHKPWDVRVQQLVPCQGKHRPGRVDAADHRGQRAPAAAPIGQRLHRLGAVERRGRVRARSSGRAQVGHDHRHRGTRRARWPTTGLRRGPSRPRSGG